MYKKIILMLAIISIVSAFVFAAVGSEEDPLISLSYLEKRLSELKIELLEKEVEQAEIEKTVEHFEALTFETGTIVLLGDSAELIVRTGDAILVDPMHNTIPDLTSGTAVKAGENLPLDHLLLNPRADGRGFMVVGEVEFWVMIKGDYQIQ